MTESWHLKLSRAQEHLDELERILKPLRHSHDYDVRETIKKTGRGTLRTCRLFSTLEVPPTAAVVLGDLLYNVRSALDHVAVSRVPRRRKFTASFPIFTVDPESAHPGDEKADAARREAWESATKGMIKPTLAAIRSHQPYNARRPPELDHIEVPLGPEDHTLALLSAFQNADKHRELITVVDALDIRSLAVREATGGKILLDRVPLLPAHQLIWRDGLSRAW
jgi:hypothetical protein